MLLKMILFRVTRSTRIKLFSGAQELRTEPIELPEVVAAKVD